jgi:hypothetical protein
MRTARIPVPRAAAILTALTLTAGVGLAVVPSAAADTSIVNGGFETADLSGWSVAGTASVTANAHSGGFAAVLGSGQQPTRDSTLTQSFTAPSAVTALTLWYRVVCPDTVNFDWASATLTDTTTGITADVLKNTCEADSGWQQASAILAPGHGYTLTLLNHDDGAPGDATFSLFDDVTLVANGVGDFSLAANPASAAVQAGASVSATITTALTAGAPQLITLTASGLPLGTQASFNPPQMLAGQSSTMNLFTPGSTPDGDYTVVLDGTGPYAAYHYTFPFTVYGVRPPLVKVSTDTLQLPAPDSQHATEVEPDTVAVGSTVVGAFQVGRFADDGGGSMDLGYAVSTDSGKSWTSGPLPGITGYAGSGPLSRVSYAALAHDARHGQWLISGLGISVAPDGTSRGAAISVSHSPDGVNWSYTTFAGFPYSAPVDLDKDWITCDNSLLSPHDGTCYLEVNDSAEGDQIFMFTSTDGGATWSTPIPTPTFGVGAQPLVQPNGTVVVPYASGTTIRAFTSADGGATWTSGVLISSVTTHLVAGGLRDDDTPSAGIDATGTLYVAWQDCRFRPGCGADDIVYSVSKDGTSWSPVTRIPIDATTSSADYFLPGLGVDHSTSGSSAKLGLYYYFYPNTRCSLATCELQVGYLSSADGGSHWSTPLTVAGPVALPLIAKSVMAPMVGDYIACSVEAGKAYALFALGRPPTDGQAFDEAMYAVRGGLAVTGGYVTSAGG